MNERDISKLRELSLEAILEQFGGERDTSDPTRNWKTTSGRITVTGARFYNHDQQQGGGGAIDLIMHLSGQPFKEAVAWLTNKALDITSLKSKHANPNKLSIQQGTVIPKSEPAKLYLVKHYLTHQRGIPETLVDNTIAAGKLWSDHYANAVFGLVNLQGKLVGVELRGTSAKPFHGVRGEKGLFFIGDSNYKIAIFVESAIDAMSYYAINSHVLVISTTGSGRDISGEAARFFRDRDFVLVAGFDHDEAGDRMAETLKQVSGCQIERQKPSVGKDWNDQLILHKPVAK